ALAVTFDREHDRGTGVGAIGIGRRIVEVAEDDEIDLAKRGLRELARFLPTTPRVRQEDHGTDALASQLAGPRAGALCRVGTAARREDADRHVAGLHHE